MGKITHTLFAVIFFMIVFCAGAQNSEAALNYTKDSLKLELKNAKHDSTRCNLLNYLVELEYDEKIWPKYNEEVKRIAEKNLENLEPNSALGIFFQKRLADAYNNIGYLKNISGSISESIRNYQMAISIQEKIRDKRGLGASYNNLGNTYQSLGKPDSALIYFNKALKATESISDIVGMAYANDNLGNYYLNKGIVNKALEFFFKALKYHEITGDKSGISNVLSNIGIVYDQLGEHKKALEYYLKALKVSESVGDKMQIANSYNNIATSYE